MIQHHLSKPWNWLEISNNPSITMQDIINHPEYPWDWNEVFGRSFDRDRELYVNNEIGRVLLVTMLDDYNNDTSTPLDNTLLILYNDYHLCCIVSYV